MRGRLSHLLSLLCFWLVALAAGGRGGQGGDIGASSSSSSSLPSSSPLSTAGLGRFGHTSLSLPRSRLLFTLKTEFGGGGGGGMPGRKKRRKESTTCAFIVMFYCCLAWSKCQFRLFQLKVFSLFLPLEKAPYHTR